MSTASHDGAQHEAHVPREAHVPGGSTPMASSRPPPRRRKTQRRYLPRQCRICLDYEEPSFPAPLAPGLGFLNMHPKPIYVSQDPTAGRLISPCICKGSQKYVHEGCLQEWRATVGPAERAYLECATCKYRYRTDRLAWATYINNGLIQLALTIVIMAFIIFLLGFFADPILNLWLLSSDDDFEYDLSFEGPLHNAWLEHFLKGFVAFGVTGFLKVFLTSSPWYWSSYRTPRNRNRRRGTGRERLEAVGYGVVLIGALTFMAAVWKFVRTFIQRSLKRMGDRVVDVGGEDDDYEEIEVTDAEEEPEMHEEGHEHREKDD